MSTSSDLKKCKIKAFCTGGIPGFEMVLSILKEEAKEIEKEDSAVLDSAIKLIQDLKSCNELLLQLIEFYPFWDEERQQCINHIQAIADKIDRFHRNTNRVQLPAAGLGIISGALVVTGLVLAPVTYGVSLGLTIAGTAVGVASAGAGTSASVSDVYVTRKKVKEAHECFEQHKKSTAKLIKMIATMVELADRIQRLSDEETIHFLQAVMSRNDGGLAKAAALGLVSSTKSAFSFIYSIPQAATGLKHLCLLISTSPILHSVLSIVPSQVSNAIINMSAEGARLAAKIGGPALTTFGYVSGVLGIAMSTGVATYTIYDMVKNESKTENAKKLRNLCEQMKQEHSELEKLYQAILFALNKKEVTITVSTAPMEEKEQEKDGLKPGIVDQDYKLEETQEQEKDGLKPRIVDQEYKLEETQEQEKDGVKPGIIDQEY